MRAQNLTPQKEIEITASHFTLNEEFENTQ